MKKKLNLVIYGFSLLLMLLTNCTETKVANINVIPKPVKIELKKGSFAIKGKILIYAKQQTPEITNLVNYFSGYLKHTYKLQTEVIQNQEEQSSRIILNIDSSISNIGYEGYILEVKNHYVKISSNSPQGVFYAFQTIFQIIDSNANGEYFIPNVLIEDKPRFQWRGMHLDVARHFFPVDFIKKYIDYIAMQKMNVFHWHLVDDQGWRIEIKKYPLLTEKAAWREGTGKEKWDYFVGPAVEGKPKYGGFYTQKEIKEIVQYAAERYVTIVPEIEMPGHTRAALDAYPELYCSGKPFKRNYDLAWEFTDPYCVGNEKTFEFIENVLSEVIELFPSGYIHIGGDEAKLTPWEKCPKCNTLMKKENIKKVKELQSWFIKRIEKFLVSKNKKLIGWDDILEGGLAPEATVMSWRGTKWGIEAVNQGHDIVMSPEEFAYFNFAQDSTGSEPNHFSTVLYLDKVYSFEPIPDSIPDDKKHHILGGQGNMWSEFMFTPEDVEHMLFPRIFAMSEVLWSPKESKDYKDFVKRLSNRLKFLNKENIKYYSPDSDSLWQKVLLEGKIILK